jgi:hypothetical protein
MFSILCCLVQTVFLMAVMILQVTSEMVLTQLRPKGDWLSLQLVDVVERWWKVEWVPFWLLVSGMIGQIMIFYTIMELYRRFHNAYLSLHRWYSTVLFSKTATEKYVSITICTGSYIHRTIKFPGLDSYIKNHNMFWPMQVIVRWYLFKNTERYWHDDQYCEIYKLYFLCLLLSLMFWCCISIMLPAQWV